MCIWTIVCNKEFIIIIIIYICKERLSILTYAKSTITYNLKKGATSFIYYFKKTRKN